MINIELETFKTCQQLFIVFVLGVHFKSSNGSSLTALFLVSLAQDYEPELMQARSAFVESIKASAAEKRRWRMAQTVLDSNRCLPSARELSSREKFAASFALTARGALESRQEENMLSSDLLGDPPRARDDKINGRRRDAKMFGSQLKKSGAK